MARLYLISSHQHGVGNGDAEGSCQQFGNPLNSPPIQRTLSLVDRRRRAVAEQRFASCRRHSRACVAAERGGFSEDSWRHLYRVEIYAVLDEPAVGPRHTRVGRSGDVDRGDRAQPRGRVGNPLRGRKRRQRTGPHAVHLHLRLAARRRRRVCGQIRPARDHLWRIVNELDIVPKLPFLGFAHVAEEYANNSGPSVNRSLACWHDLATYLNLLDASQPIAAGCLWPKTAPAVAAPLRAAPKLARPTPATAAPAAKDIALSAPAGGVSTINITIRIGGTD
jgi:hypothetical protein